MTMQHDHGLLATSRYLPWLRLERSEVFNQHRWMAPGLRSLAKGQRCIANWDEDVVTMSVEALRCLMPSLQGQAPHSLSLASTTPPFAERINAGIVAAALGLAPELRLRDLGSSVRSASSELIAALTQPQSGAQLIVAAERRIARPASSQEMISGDGAAAALVGQGPVIASLVGSHSVYADFVDHFRENGHDGDYAWEERWVRDEGYMKIGVGAIQTALERAQVSAAKVAHFVMPATLSKINEAVAKRLGLAPTSVASTHAETVGDTGSAQALAMLDTVLRQAAPGALILVAVFGYGCDVLLLRRTALPCPGAEPLPGKSETSYLKYLSFTQQIDLEWGMRAEMDNKTALTAAWRDQARIANFQGGRCRACGTVQFPSTAVCVNPACKAQHSQDPTSLADAPAHVMSHTSDFLAYTPHPPFQFGHIDFEGGGRVLMEFADAEQDELRPGLPVRMVFRIKELDAKRGYRRYFWKATPVRNPS
jgi:hydroxymethylglutaryl-CoA synthase